MKSTNGSMEGGLDRAWTPFVDFMKGMGAASALTRVTHRRFTDPMIVKTPKIADDPAKAIDNISRELNEGVSCVIFVETESAAEVRPCFFFLRFRPPRGSPPFPHRAPSG